MTTKTIVVGTDGTDTSRAAVEWAAREAGLRKLPLRIVHAYDWDWRESRIDVTHTYVGVADEIAEAVLGGARARAHEIAPEIAVETEAIAGQAATRLIEVSHSAELVVLGSRGRGGFTGLLLGSVSQQLATHAACPVVVVRSTPATTGPVAVGVDDSPAAEEVLGVAFASAATRGVPLAVIHAYLPPIPLWLTNVRATDVDTPNEDAYERSRIDALLAPWRDKYPQLPVDLVVTHASIASALVEASRTAQLVIVGSRGRGTVSGALLGSAGLQLLHHAHCPVYIVRHA